MSVVITITGASIYSPIEDTTSVQVCDVIFTGTYGGTTPQTVSGATSVLSGYTKLVRANRPSMKNSTVIAIKGGTFAGIKLEYAGGSGSITGSSHLYTDGVLYYDNAALATVSGETVSNKSGGALNFSGSRGTIFGSTFTKNNSSSYGGAIALSTSELTVNNTWFEENTAGSTYKGGAIYVNKTSTANISGSTFYNNSSYDGAAISGESTSLVNIKNSLFDKNETADSRYGGAIYLQKSTADIYGSTFSNNDCHGGHGGAIYSTQSVTVSGSTFISNAAGTHAGAIMINAGTADIDNSVFTENNSVSYGGAISAASNAETVEISKTYFNLNTAGAHGGALYLTGKGGLVHEIKDTTFSGNSAGNYGGAIYVSGNSNTLNISNSKFVGNTSTNHGAGIYSTVKELNITGTTFTGNNNTADSKNGGALYYANTAGNITIGDGTVFDGNSTEGVGGALAIYKGLCTITGDVKFLTATDTIYVTSNGDNTGTLKFEDATVTMNSGISVNSATTTVIKTEFIFNNTSNFNITGQLDFQDKNSKITFAGKKITFKKYDDAGENTIANPTDFTNVTITIAGNRKDGDVIAENVSAIGTVKVDNAFQYAELSGTNLVVKDVAAAISSGDIQTSYTGNGVTVMDGGAVGTLFATKSNESDIATKISGGKVESNLVAGAYAKATDAGFSGATIGKVELLIGGTAELADGSRAYAGGYLYGNAEDAKAAAEAQLTVDKVDVNLTGGTVGGNLYGGAHARQFGNAKVDTVNITVNDGSHSRIYAGGWAEKGAVSSVGTSTVIISGGTVDYLYGGGANADGKTYVTTTNITVSDAAVVNTIFMGGRYGYSWVDNVNLTFAGADKVLNRLSGVSSAGMDYAEATVVELKTNVTANLIDYVDKFVINEGYMLTAVDEFYLGDRNNETGATEDFTTFDFIAEGEANWTAVAGISDFTNAKFAVNGTGLTAWDGKSAIAIDGYSLTYDATDKTIKLAQITA